LQKIVLLNPKAASGRAARLEPEIHAWLHEHGEDTQLFITSDAVHARQTVAALPRESRVVLVGGDGTVHQLLPALLAGAHSLGLVPCGSGNDTARALGLLGMPWRAALAHALQAPVQGVDLGAVTVQGHETLFISSFAAGFDAAVALRAQRSPKWLVGMPRYLYATLLELAALKRHEVALTVDARHTERAALLFCSTLNTPTYGSGMPAVPHARVNDGALNLLVAGQFNRLGTLLMLPRLLLGKHLSHARVKSQAYAQLTMEATAPMPLAADGEPIAPQAYASRISVRVLPQALACVSHRPVK
jgi:diacylglycerol kinase (ATP)